MSETERNRAFKARVQQRRAVLLPGVANPLTALIAADLGFEALYLTGAGIANMYLGLPDLGLTTLTDVATRAARRARWWSTCRWWSMPTPASATRSTWTRGARARGAGAKAIQIEDQVFPKKCGHFEGKAVIPTREMVAQDQGGGRCARAMRTSRSSPAPMRARSRASTRRSTRARAFIDGRRRPHLRRGAVTTEAEIRAHAVAPRLCRSSSTSSSAARRRRSGRSSALDRLGFALRALRQCRAAGGDRRRRCDVLGALHRHGSLDRVADRARLLRRPPARSVAQGSFRRARAPLRVGHKRTDEE